MKIKIRLLDKISDVNHLQPFWQLYLNFFFEKEVLNCSEKSNYKKAVAELSTVIDKAISENLAKFEFSEDYELQICCMNVPKSSQASISFTQIGPFDDEGKIKEFASFITGFICGLAEKGELSEALLMCHKDIFKMFKKSLKKHLIKLLGKEAFEIIS